MANVPTPRSYPQTLGEMQDGFLSRFGLSGMKKGSAVLSILEAAAQSDVRNSQDIFSLLNAIALKRAKGPALDRIGADEGVPRQLESRTTGSVSLGDSSITKVATRISQASPAPIAGSVAINVVDASSFPGAGAIYLGRGTSNYEGPLAYNGRTNNGTNWTLTLTGATVRFHNQNESVILAQGGNRVIGSGSVVQTPQGNARDAVKFSTLYSATIPDGEVLVINVPVVASTPGVIGNVPAGSIRDFSALPFPGATVTNPLPFTNGLRTEDDEEYRERIAAVRNSRSKGTPLALKTSAIGVVAADENRKVVSATYVPGIDERPGVLYIDDGSGYEERAKGVAIEVIVDDALGGETDFELVNRPVSKAFLPTSIAAPYTLVSGAKLAFKVGGLVSEHTFDGANFKAIGNASAYEVVASVNADPSLTWSARTANAGTTVAFFSKADINEDIELATPSGTDANEWLGVPSGRVDSLKLYRNDRLLSKDGKAAIVLGRTFSFWQPLTGPQTLQVAIDNTPSVTYTFTDSDFITAGTGFVTLGLNTLDAWAKVLNARIPGVTTDVNLGALRCTSNRGKSAKARVAVTGGTLVTNGVFIVADVSGTDKDYVLDRNTSQVKLVQPLVVGDRLAAGTTATRAFLESPALNTVTLAQLANFWLAIDGQATDIKVGVTSAIPLGASVAAGGIKPWGNRLRITATTGSFSLVHVGDQVVLWDSALSASIKGSWYVGLVANDGSYIELDHNSQVSCRSDHTATLLANGKVLVCGGYTSLLRQGATRSCEVYDPTTHAWTATADMAVARVGHTATLLANGKVLVYGGSQTNAGAKVVANAEVYDPATGQWTPTSTASQPAARRFHAAALGSDNKVYVCGGRVVNDSASAATASYDPATDTWATLPGMGTARYAHTLNLLSTTLMAVGGESAGAVLASAEEFDPAGPSWTARGAIQAARQGHRAVVLNDGKLFVVGGSTSPTDLAAVPSALTDLWDGAAWAAGQSMAKARANFALSGLSVANKVLAGFGDSSAGAPYTETYDHAGPTWTSNADPNFTGSRRFSTLTMVSGGTAGLVVGGRSAISNLDRPLAGAEYIDGSGWHATDPAIGSTNLAEAGVNVVRSGSRLVKLSVPPGTNYTASSLSDALGTALDGLGAQVSTYRTTKLRASTNTYAAEALGSSPAGDIMLAGADAPAQLLGFTRGLLETNLDGHLGSVESSTPDLGSPAFFDVAWIKGSSGTSKPYATWSSIATNAPRSDNQLVGLHVTRDGVSQSRFGNAYQFSSLLTTQAWDGLAGGLNYATLRTAPEHDFTPDQRVFFASAWALGPYDNLVAVADQDVTSKRFSPNVYRKAKPTGNTYSSTITLQDADPTPATSLARAFGLAYDWTDYAVYMRARTKSHSSDAMRMAVWRWWRHGPEGNSVRTTYEYPDQPGDAVKVVTNDLDAYTYAQIKLAGGALKTGASLRAGTYLGATVTSISGGFGHTIFAVGLAITSAARTANATTLTLGLPGGVIDHGLLVGNVVYVKSIDPNFTSGAYSITARTASTLSYTEAAADQGATANAGTVSRDSSEASFANLVPALGVDDFVRLESTGAPSLALPVKGQTCRVNAFGPQYVGVEVAGYSGANSTTLSWHLLRDVSAFKLFANPGQTVSAIVAAVNALAAAPNSTCTLTGVATGAGTGTVTQSTAEELGAYPSYYSHSDGINFVKSQVNPADLTQHYQLVLKDPVASSLASNADWQNEDVRLVPTGVKALATWLMQPATSGLFTAAVVEPSSRAHHLQIHTITPGSGGGIEIQGGSANAWTSAVRGDTVDVVSGYMVARIPRADLQGFQAGQWVSLDNTSTLPKTVFDSDTKLNSVTVAGKFTFDSGFTKVWDQAANPHANDIAFIEKMGGFICYGGLSVFSSTVEEGDWVIVSKPAAPSGNAPQVSDSNVGTYRVVRAVNNLLDGTAAFWIENAGAIEETSELDVKFIKRNSVMPGDVLTISTGLWGAANRGTTWTIKSVGDAGAGPWLNFYTFTVDVSTASPAAAAPAIRLGSDVQLVKLVDQKPTRLVKQVVGTSIEQTDGTLARIKLASDLGWQSVGETAGSVITALDKLRFPVGASQASDGYHYNTGLIHEVNRVIYGDTSDTTTYPGVAAAGAKINIQGPLVRRTPFAILVRLRSGFPATDVEAQVRSAVASVINQSPHGQSIAISDIIAQASSVVGVESVVPITKYSVGNDLIPVQPFEKALVLNLDQDVLVSFVGA